MQTGNNTFLQARSLIEPPERLTVSKWANEHAMIPQEGNAEPGRYRLSRMPHQEAMLDDLNEPGVREVYWMLASQAGGKTLCLILLCEFAIAVLRKSIIAVRATRETAMEWMRDKFLPTVRETECMDGLLKNPRQRDSESTSLNRKFPGGGLKVVGAKSPAAFRGSSAPIIFQDEIDSYMAGKEGDPCALADRAAITFRNSWKLKCSTPTLKGFSRIDAGYLRGDQQKYFLPCPYCGEFQWLKFSQLKFTFTAEEHERRKANTPDGMRSPWQIGDFPIRDTKLSIYVCEHCHAGWTDLQRVFCYMSGHPDNPPIWANGKPLRAHWRPTAPFNGIRSRHLSGMYLTIGLEQGFDNYLHQFAEKFLEAKSGGRETLMVWTNIFASEAFEDPHEKMDWKTIKERAEDFTVPEQVVWIAFGMDVHPDRVEILSYGWGDEQESWCLDHAVIFGDFDMPAMQDRVWDHISKKRFTHSVLGELAYSAGAIDSGKQTKVQAVYAFCAKHRLGLNLLASVKGFDQALGAVYQKERERRYGGIRFNFNVDYLKSLVFDRLRNNRPGPRYIHFHKPQGGRFGDEFYIQLCSERRVPERQSRGGVVWHWQKHTSSARNEILDMTVYAFGIFEVCRQEEWIARKWKEVQQKLREANPIEPATEPRDVVLDAPKEVKMPDLAQRTPERKSVPVSRRRRMVFRSPFAKRL